MLHDSLNLNRKDSKSSYAIYLFFNIISAADFGWKVNHVFEITYSLYFESIYPFNAPTFVSFIHHSMDPYKISSSDVEYDNKKK
jgi:hypothetical protein